MSERSVHRLSFFLGLLSSWLLLSMGAWAQEGHPLTGTWRGNWGSTTEGPNPVTLVMSWDGENVTGILNPGPDSVAVRVRFEPSTWDVQFDVELDGSDGNDGVYTFEGTLENYGSLFNQRIVGTWSHPEGRGDFGLTRQ